MPSKKKDEEGSKHLLRQAYGSATQQLRENHRDEFEDLYSSAAAGLGIDRKPRLSPEQKAEQQMDALLAEYPHLRERAAGVQEEPV